METVNVIKIGNPLLRLIFEPIADHEVGTDELKTLADLIALYF